MFGKKQMEFLISQLDTEIKEIQKKLSNGTLSASDIATVTGNINVINNLCNVANIGNSKLMSNLKEVINNSYGLQQYLQSNGFFPHEVSMLENSINSIKPKLLISSAVKVTGKAGGFVSKSVTKRVEKNMSSFASDVKSLFPKF